MTDLRCYKPLSMQAADEEDLKVLSACLQDAVAKIGDFAFLPAQRRFAFVANRFVWECAVDRTHGPFARVRTGVHFDDVLGVQHQNLRLDAHDAVVDILSIGFEAGVDGGGAVIISLAGGGAIRLAVESVNMHCSDISDPWRTRSRPDHEVA